MAVIGRLVKVEKEGRLVKLWVRLSRKEKKAITVYDFYPYFYVPDEGGEHVSVYGNRLRKVVAEDPSQVPELRGRYISHYEADIPYVRRFLIDTGVYDCLEVPRTEMISWREVKPATCEGIPYRVWFLDIEVMSDVLPDASAPIYPLSSISIYDTYVGKYVTLIVAGGEVRSDSDDWRVLTFPDEDSLVVAFVRLLRTANPDILVGWNVMFDVDYLRARIEKLGYELPLEGVQLFDMLEGFRRLQKRRSYKLKAVALEDGLISNYVQFSTSMTPQELAEYNKQDVWIMVELEKRYGILDFHLQLRGVVGVNELGDTLYNSILVDTALLRLARKRGVVLPSKPEEVEEAGYEGAVVLEPPTGIFEGVAVFDMARYYPSIIISFNISPDTLDSNGDIKYPPTGVSFRSDRVGLIPEVVRTWLKLRGELEKSGAPRSKVDAVKFLTNSVYGVFGHERFRLYDVRLASTVTAIGREGILYAKKLAEEKGYRVLYGDSVAGDALVCYFTLRGEPVCETIEELFNRYAKYARVRPDGKEEIYLKGFHLLTFALDTATVDVGLKEIVRVIRHRVRKPMCEVVTESGRRIAVTNDHSLIVHDNVTKTFKSVTCNELCIDTDRYRLVTLSDEMLAVWEGGKASPSSLISPPSRNHLQEVLRNVQHTTRKEIRANDRLCKKALEQGTDEGGAHKGEGLKGSGEIIRLEKVAGVRVFAPREVVLVYDIEVEDYHTFLASGIFVHNTDSLHVQIPFEKAEELTSYLNENIERYFRERYGVKECTIGLKFEKYFSKIMYFGVKKRYAGLLVWEKGKEKRELVTVGLEAVRTDQSRFSQEFQERLLELVLSGAGVSKVNEFIEEARREMRSKPPIEIALVKGLSKGLDEYKANAPHVRAVLYSNKYLGTRFGKGSRVYILWVKAVKGLPQTDVIAFDEDTKLPEIVVDWEKMEDVNIWQKAKPILEVVRQNSGALREWLK